jgi:hypothetical protein
MLMSQKVTSPPTQAQTTRRKMGKKKRRIKKIIYYDNDAYSSSPRDDDDDDSSTKNETVNQNYSFNYSRMPLSHPGFRAPNPGTNIHQVCYDQVSHI